MATLVEQVVVDSGLEATYAAAAGGGDGFLNTGDQIIHIKNGDVSPMTVTVVSQASPGGLDLEDPTIIVTNAEERFIGPFPPAFFNDGNGLVQLTYSAVTSVTIAILKI